MEHYVTLFDSLFLPQGLALYLSMERHVEEYTLWILCVDETAYEVLNKLQLPNVRLLQLDTLETAELVEVKPGRSKGEYCWTLTPFAPRFVFEADTNVERVTYIDADMWFRGNPKIIFNEFEASGKKVLITEHAYASENDQSSLSGYFCVQFITFKRLGGECVRKWWENKCVEWCYARHEDGKFGDQKYLDDWPTRFEECVHVLRDKELLQAPWNATRFPYSSSLVWHFHGARVVVRNNKLHGLWCGNYPLPKVTRQEVYRAYLADLDSSIRLMKTHMVNIASQNMPSIIWRVGLFARGIYRLVWKFRFGVFIK